MNPVPGYDVSTPYGKRGSYWSCDEDANGNGIHTGHDFAAPSGAKVVAARPGTVQHCSHGSAFGSHQVDVVCNDGTRDFYAHMRSRVAHGTKVGAGDKVGEVGSEGNATGPHLHFERHATQSGGWSCSVVRDPQPSVDYGEDEDVDLQDEISEWSPDEGTSKNKTTVGKTLNQARGYAEDGYDRVKALQSKVNSMDSKLDKILSKLS